MVSLSLFSVVLSSITVINYFWSTGLIFFLRIFYFSIEFIQKSDLINRRWFLLSVYPLFVFPCFIGYPSTVNLSFNGDEWVVLPIIILFIRLCYLLFFTTIPTPCWGWKGVTTTLKFNPVDETFWRFLI